MLVCSPSRSTSNQRTGRCIIETDGMSRQRDDSGTSSRVDNVSIGYCYIDDDSFRRSRNGEDAHGLFRALPARPDRRGDPAGHVHGGRARPRLIGRRGRSTAGPRSRSDRPTMKGASARSSSTAMCFPGRALEWHPWSRTPITFREVFVDASGGDPLSWPVDSPPPVMPLDEAGAVRKEPGSKWPSGKGHRGGGRLCCLPGAERG